MNRNDCVIIGLLQEPSAMIQPSISACIPVLLGALITGCADSGTLWIDGRAERLRTMLVRADSTEDATRATVVLSNGLFSCKLPELDDPARAQQAVQNMITAACREGAVHLNLTLWRTPEGDWSGTYPGLSYAGPLDLSPKQTRLSDAVFYSVEEAILVEYVNLDRAYAVESAILEEGAGDGGQVDVIEETTGLGGGFSMPSLGLTGTFQAQWCEADDNQFALLESSPAFVCP